MPYYDWKPLHALLQLLSLVITLYMILWCTNFSMHYYNGQLLYDLLQLITFICTVAKNCSVSTIPIHNFCMHYWILQLLASLLQMKNCMQQWHLHFFECYDNCWFKLALLQLTTFACPISIQNFGMHHCHSQLLYANCLCTTTIQDTFCMYCYNWKCFCSNIAIDNFSYTIMIIDFCMHYCNWQI